MKPETEHALFVPDAADPPADVEERPVIDDAILDDTDYPGFLHHEEPVVIRSADDIGGLLEVISDQHRTEGETVDTGGHRVSPLCGWQRSGGDESRSRHGEFDDEDNQGRPY